MPRCHAWKTWVCWAFLDTIHTLGQFSTTAFWLGLKTWQGNAHTKHIRACSLLEMSLVLLLGLLPPYGTCVEDCPSSFQLGALGLGTTLRWFRSHGLAKAFARPSLGTGALLLGRPMGMWRRPRPPRGTTCHYGTPFSPLGSARGAPLGTTMLDWAQVGTCCQLHG